MSAAAQKRMTADEFLAWAMEQPEGSRYELFAGQVIAMSPERAMHGSVKANVAYSVMSAIRTNNLPCRAYIDRMAVRVNANTIYEPDILVRCGDPLDGDAIEVTDPLIIVEVVSPSSVRRDTGIKLADYLSISSVRHYLIVLIDKSVIIHHRRDTAGDITTTIHKDGSVHLDPPNITLTGIFDDL